MPPPWHPGKSTANANANTTVKRPVDKNARGKAGGGYEDEVMNMEREVSQGEEREKESIKQTKKENPTPPVQVQVPNPT